MVGLHSPPTTTGDAPEMEQVIREYNSDSRNLEDVHSYGAAPLPRVSDSPVPHVLPLSTLIGLVTSPGGPTKILIPQREDAIRLFACYVEHVDALQHVIHVPSVRERFELLYDNFEKPQPELVDGGLLALLLAVLGHTAGFWALGSSHGSLFDSRPDALALSTYWLRCTLDSLEHVWRVEESSMEALQAQILTMFLLYHTEGLSSRARRLMATALSDAKDLGLHMTDSPHRKAPENTQAEIIDAEMRRRVWWHIVSTAWSAALWGGPHDGVYTVQPSHMQVKKPRNVTDEDLMIMPADFSRPADEPTSTTYYLQRIILAEICREVADVMLEIRAVQDPRQIPYSRILTLDGKFAEILNGPLASGMVTAEDDGPVYNPRRPHLRQQYFTYLTTEARRCKLHLPYLLRLQQDSQYIVSRNICLQSARNILRLKHILPSEVSDESSGSVKMIGLMHHFCCAIVILAMDLCVNKSAGGDHERKAEIRAACRILEDARDGSRAAGLFLDSLTTIFRKHKVRVQCDQPPNGVAVSEFPVEHKLHQTTADQRGRFGVGLFPADYMGDSEDGGLAEPGFDTMWQGYLDLGEEPQAWDALFNDIELGVP
ncbi:hypothetical protein LTR49_004085 [Elasticomyces elasticus]|nr:hypothetical protein LTR49_004085 [Elasticomyces elasticus]